MVEILFASGQLVCTAGLLYGAWLAITHTQWTEARRLPARERAARALDPKEMEVWRNYLACDV